MTDHFVPHEYDAASISVKQKIVIMNNGATVPMVGIYVMLEGEITEVDEMFEDGWFVYQVPTGEWVSLPFSSFNFGVKLQ